MKKFTINIFISLIVYLLVMACESKPKVIEGEPIEGGVSMSNFKNLTDKPAMHDGSADEHKVKVEEVLNTE